MSGDSDMTKTCTKVCSAEWEDGLGHKGGHRQVEVIINLGGEGMERRQWRIDIIIHGTTRGKERKPGGRGVKVNTREDMPMGATLPRERGGAVEAKGGDL